MKSITLELLHQMSEAGITHCHCVVDDVEAAFVAVSGLCGPDDWQTPPYPCERTAEAQVEQWKQASCCLAGVHVLIVPHLNKQAA